MLISYSNLADNIPTKGEVAQYEQFHLLFQYVLNMSQTSDCNCLLDG